ncbi:MAG TPA: M48 family metallopeptidase, partial [Gammaproteobacteria bacterium]
MDFFQRQDQARRKTGILVLYFILAVALIVLAVNLVIYFSVSYFATAQYSSVHTPHDWFDDTAWLYISLFTLILIVSGSLFRLVSLMGGGHAVAEMAGARLVDLETNNLDEKKYINVVEEMAIASGVPVPVLYIMDNEPGINAFVAGYQPTECVMVVTEGTLKNLNRDELQGVVGHEFSHILNGDMRINVRLIAILAGILLIGKVGELLMRGSSRSRGKSAGGGVALGLALFVIGYIGLFFGRLIKAAISRQREFLADASSVQFTRNPKGIAGALFKIRESVSGTYLNNSHAEDMSHMCFGETLKIGFGQLLATHPPLDERINAVDPSYLKVMRAKDIISRQAEHKADNGISSFANVNQYNVTADQLTASVGNPGLEHIAYGVALHHSLQDLLQEQFHTGSGAKAIIYALLILQTEKDAALALLGQHESSEMLALINRLLGPLAQLDKRQRLPLIDLTMSALKQLTVYEVELFKQQLETLIKSDNRFTLFEFVVLTIIKKHLSEKA